MRYIISKPLNPFSEEIHLPVSKSISNRILIMNALSGNLARLDNLAESDDTKFMKKALNSDQRIKDIGHAGTAMRFLTAYYSLVEGEVILTGSDRMKQRPIGELVSALRGLGASIEYEGNDGFPPLKIKGGNLSGRLLEIDGTISSQYISAILMVSPCIRGGLEILIKGEIVSKPYISMTLSLMKNCGINYRWEGNRIVVYEGKYNIQSFTAESDWSAASYWYSIAALSNNPGIVLPLLFRNSIQGDSVVGEIFTSLRVRTKYHSGGIELVKTAGALPDSFTFDFTGSPDLVQTMAVLLCALEIPFRFTGTQTLLIKETDRIAAIKTELGKMGYLLESAPDGRWLSWSGERKAFNDNAVIETYNDHRMAMAFAPLACVFDKIIIADPMVVSKSYPGFWEDLKRVGFRIEEQD